MMFSRRRFLAALPGLSVCRLAPARTSAARTHGHSSDPRSEIGYKTICWDLQFLDTDPITLKYADAEKYAEAVAEAGANSHLVYAVTNTGLALFNSQFLPKFRNLPDNFLGDYLRACRRRGIKTELYYSLGAQKTLDTNHPDWLILDAKSKPVEDTDDPAADDFIGRINYPCFNSPFREFCLKQVKELADRYSFDYWDVDILIWFGRRFVCYNPYCLEKWRARTGRVLPRPLPQELYPEYLDFVADTHRSIYKAIKDQLKACGRDVPTTHNSGLDYSLDDFVMAESNPGGADFYNMSSTCKVYRAHARGRKVQINPHRANKYVDYVNAPIPALTWQTAVAVSHNAGLMWCDAANVDGSIDPMAVQSIKEAFRVADRLIPKVRGTVPYAEVAILFSERDHLLIEGTKSADAEDFRGAYKLLTDLHWPFDVVADEHVSLGELSRYQLLIVPSLQYLASEQREILLGYLRNGGHLFFCGHCAVLDRDGHPHRDPQFGLVRIHDTYQRRGYVKTSFPISDDRLKTASVVTVEAEANLAVLGRLAGMSSRRRGDSADYLPSFPLDEADLPVIVAGRKGQGRFVYAGYAFFQEYLKQGLPVIGQAFEQLVADLYQPSVRVEGPTVVESIYNRIGSNLLVSLVNGVTSRPCTGSYINIVEVLPISGIKILVGKNKVNRATDLLGRELVVTTEMGRTVVTVPQLEQYDLISLQLGGDGVGPPFPTE